MNLPLVTFFAAALSASTALAAVSITGTYVGGTAPTINNTYGSLEFALNMGGLELTRDGIAFTTAGDTPSGATRNFLVDGGTGATINVTGVSQDGKQGWATIQLSGSDTLFHSIAFSGGFDIHVTGLDAGKSYQLQFLLGDPRNGASAYPYNGTAYVFDSASNTDNTPLSIASSSTGDEFAMLTAVVSNSTSFQFRLYKEPNGPPLSGLVVHSVPEPSAALLGGLGLLALLRRRR